MHLGIWAAQDALQPLQPMEPIGCHRPHLRRTCRRRAEARAHHDRRDASESPSHGCEPAQKGDVPRRIGRTKGGLNPKLHTVCDGDGRPISRSTVGVLHNSGFLAAGPAVRGRARAMLAPRDLPDIEALEDADLAVCDSDDTLSGAPPALTYRQKVSASRKPLAALSLADNCGAPEIGHRMSRSGSFHRIDRSKAGL
jgi:hypothetical protein